MPFTERESIAVTVEILEGLAAAPRARIVHRDLKPDNIFLTKTGAKIFDFGLARFDGRSDDDPEAPTQERPLTEEHTILGTAPSMSPEQIKGDRADARADVFAVGDILYEILAGRRPFHGEVFAEVSAATLEREPESVSPDGLNPIVRRSSGQGSQRQISRRGRSCVRSEKPPARRKLLRRPDGFQRAGGVAMN